VNIERDAAMPGAKQPAHDIGTHPTQPDHSQFHRLLLSGCQPDARRRYRAGGPLRVELETSDGRAEDGGLAHYYVNRHATQQVGHPARGPASGE
jgi:hypothetical protein